MIKYKMVMKKYIAPKIEIQTVEPASTLLAASAQDIPVYNEEADDSDAMSKQHNSFNVWDDWD